jgi:hypothetical protein
MAERRTTGIRAIVGTGEGPYGGEGDQKTAVMSLCHVVHAEQVGELHLGRDNLERLLAGGSFF